MTDFNIDPSEVAKQVAREELENETRKQISEWKLQANERQNRKDAYAKGWISEQEMLGNTDTRAVRDTLKNHKDKLDADVETAKAELRNTLRDKGFKPQNGTNLWRDHGGVWINPETGEEVE